jgi:DNA-directed RNA polymerase subunit RPC12/RpoP
VTVKQVALELQVDPGLVRSLLTQGLIPAEKKRGSWVLSAAAVERLREVLSKLRAPLEIETEVPGAIACPHCGHKSFRPDSGDRGWGEVYQCLRCKFSMHEHNLKFAEMVDRSVADFRARQPG